MKKSIIIAAIVLVVLVISLIAFLLRKKVDKAKITTFDECVVAGYPVMESFPEQCRTPQGKTFTRQVSGQDITVKGIVVCLPHKNTKGPQTLECAYGIKDANEDYYGLSDTNNRCISSLSINKEIRVNGTFRSNQNESKYNIVGTIEITSLETL